MDEPTLLRALRATGPAAEVARSVGLDETALRRECAALLRSRLPPAELRLRGGVTAPVEIIRDGHGIPHIYATATPDLYVGLGFAMAQDRLWQMDLMRRRGLGTLAEVLGPAALPSDVTHRTLDLGRIAAAEVDRIDERTATVLGAFVAGINRWVEECGDGLPIEFDLLEYRPAPWTVRDVLVALRGFWWSLNGRLQSLVVGEAARLLPAGPLRDAFLTPNLADERIVPPGSPQPPAGLGPVAVGVPFSGSDDGATGSNNWAVGRGLTASGAGVLGSDPHQPFQLPSNWYECRLVGPEDDVAGAAWAGVPGIWFGRNRQIAWGLTNNNVSIRDLYVEEVDPTDPTRYRDGATWRRFAQRTESIAVRGRAPETLVVRESARGPLVNHLLPPVQPDGDPPLALRWVGQEHLDDVRALLAVGRAQNWEAFREALRDWAVPTFNWGYADVAGNVGYQCASRLPVRGRVTRGFRSATDPKDQWLGALPFDAQPHLANPSRGFVSSANNAPVPDDYPYPYVGAFASGERATRVRETLEQATSFDRDRCAALQNDTLSAQARQLVPPLLRRLSIATDPAARTFARHLEGWDYRYETVTPAPTCFETFLAVWKRKIAEARFPAHLVPVVTGQGNLFARLLGDDDLAWFAADKRTIIVDCAREALATLSERFGADPADWAWGKVHQAHFRHPLSNSLSAATLDVGPVGVAGAASCVRNTGLGAPPRFAAESGAEYRLIVDLADPHRFWATQNIGQSGQPGSPYYQDQFADWVRGDYHVVHLEREAVEAEQTAHVRLEGV